MRKVIAPQHTQVPFFTLGNGAVVHVDEGMLDILLNMRRIGLLTQFSCEGTNRLEEAYVLMDTRSAFRFEWKMRTTKLSPELREIANKFLKGPRWYDFSITTKKSEFYRIVLKRDKSDFFRVERLFQFPRYGFRTTYRWDPTYSPMILRLLEELH